MIALNTFLEQRLSSEEKQKMGHKDVGLWLWNHLEKGKQNVLADALSREDEDVEELFCAISIIQPD